MAFLYNISIRAFGLGISLGALFNRKAKLLRQGRKGLLKHAQEKMQQVYAGSQTKTSIWVHCASLGEFEQGRPLIEALRAKYPEKPIVVTFFSPSGYEIRKNYASADAVFYLPADTPGNAQQFIKAIHPEMAIFVKYEYWYNYLNELQRANIPAYVISALFRPDMTFFKRTPMGDFMRKTLGLLTHYFVQNEASKQLLGTIGISAEKVTVSGDTRFDRVVELAKHTPKLPLIEAFGSGPDNPWIMVCGSTWPADEELILELMQSAEGQKIKFVIAPHEIHQERIEKLIGRSGRQANTVRYTDLSHMSEEKAKQLAVRSNLLIVDTIGVLSGVYRFGKAAYIGGGFGRGIHNTLEAATWGMPIIFGPNYLQFAEAVELVELNAARSVKDEKELQEAVKLLLDDPAFCAVKGATAESYVKGRAGATEIIMSRISK